MFKKIFLTQINFLSINIAWTISSLLLLPIYIQYLSPADYGMLAILMVVVAFGSFISTGNLQMGYTAYYFDTKKEDRLGQLHEVLKIAWKFIAIYLTLGILLIMEFNLFLDTIISPFLLVFALLIAAFKSIQSIYNVYLQHEKSTKSYTRINGATVIINFLLQLLFLMILDWRIYSIFLALLIAQMIGVLYTYISLSHFNHTYKLIKKPLLVYSSSLIPLFLLEWLTGKGDRILVEKYFDFEQTGIYALAFNIAFLLSAIGTSYFNATRPEFFSFLNRQTKLYTIFYSNLFLGLVLILSLSSMVLYYLSLHLDFLTSNDKYLEVKNYVGITVITMSVNALVRFLRQVFIYFKDVKSQILLSILNLILFATFLFLLHPFGSIKAIMHAMLAANLVVLIVMLFYIGTMKKAIVA